MPECSIFPVILSGGIGARLWPLSRTKYPKQFLDLISSSSLFSETIKRIKGKQFFDPVIVCNEEHRFLVAENLRMNAIDAGSIILEPCSRNTAPAIGAAAEFIISKDENAIMLVMPSDHIIKNQQAFLSAVENAREVAEAGYIVAFALNADRPEIGYGYIKKGRAVSLSKSIFEVEKFVEKPNKLQAEKFVKSGQYAWNSGIYLFRADALLRELSHFHPDISNSVKLSVRDGENDLCFFRLDEKLFQTSPSISIDYAIIEKTKNIAVIEVEMGWDDMGSWQAVRKLVASDPYGNVNLGDGVLLDCKNVYARSEGPLISALGVDDLNIIATDDSVLVIPNDRSNEVRAIVKMLQEKKRIEYEEHSKVFRPWGSYRNLRRGEGYLVKEILVNPGAKLSLQYHKHRAEHWVVVEGEATVINLDKEFTLSVNQSIYIPLGAKHRLVNTGKTELRLIEVQSGDYIGEDDIIRLEDDFGREKDQ